MIYVIGKRLLQMLSTLVLVSLFSFSIVYFAPGDPLYMYTTPGIAQHKMTTQQLDDLKESLGLNGNISEQYVSWVKRMLKGDWGVSLNNHKNVRTQIMNKLPNTLWLMGMSLLLSILLSIPLGLVAGLKKNTSIDTIISGISYVGLSVPSFWLGIILIIVFSLKLNLLPSNGMRTVGESGLLDLLKHSILPIIVLSINNTAIFIRYIRANTITQISEDYILTAISKGISTKKILSKHVLKNTLLPIITLVGMNFGMLVTGSFIVETVFSWPGIGTLGMKAINNRDYPIIMAVTMLSCTVLLIGNCLADILYSLADPRIAKEVYDEK